MIFILILLVHFKAITAESSSSLPSPFFKDETPTSQIPVPFFIERGECIFLPPFSSDIWDKSSLEDFFYNHLTFPEKQKIIPLEARYLSPSTAKTHFPFQRGELSYFFTPIIAPSLKKFLLSILKKQQKSSYPLKTLLTKKTAVKIIIEYLKLVPRKEMISLYLQKREKTIDVYRKILTKYSQKEKKLQNKLTTLKEQNDLSLFFSKENLHPYKNPQHKLKKKIIHQQKKQEKIARKLEKYLRKLPVKIDLEFQLNLKSQLKKWDWTRFFDANPEFRTVKKWEEIYPAPPPPSHK